MARPKRNYTQRAIELAIAGGWEHGHLAPDFFREKNFREWKKYTIYHPDPHKFFLDPKFWQALQKGLKAKEPKHKWHMEKASGVKITLVDWFENTMHSFIDHLLTGAQMEGFFEDLLTHHKARL